MRYQKIYIIVICTCAIYKFDITLVVSVPDKMGVTWSNKMNYKFKCQLVFWHTKILKKKKKNHADFDLDKGRSEKKV